MSNATISGRERRNEAMWWLRFALRCMVMLDSKSFNTPPRYLGRAFMVPLASYWTLLSAATDGEVLVASKARRRRALKEAGTRRSNATISGRERHREAMRRLRNALRCMVMLDHACLRTPPRPTAALSPSVTNHTRCS
jgi:hypothetical protein